MEVNFDPIGMTTVFFGPTEAEDSKVFLEIMVEMYHHSGQTEKAQYIMNVLKVIKKYQKKTGIA